MFDPVAPFIPALVMLDDLFTGLSARDAGLCSLFHQGIPKPISIIATICQQPVCSGKITQ
jgi:hypothetical protein